MTGRSSENRGLVPISFGDVVEFATLDSLAAGNPAPRAARFVVTELIGGERLLSAAKIMVGVGEERLSRSGTMEPPVRRIDVDPWDIGRVAIAMLWQFGPAMDIEELREMLASATSIQPVEYPTF